MKSFYMKLGCVQYMMGVALEVSERFKRSKIRKFHEKEFFFYRIEFNQKTEIQRLLDKIDKPTTNLAHLN